MASLVPRPLPGLSCSCGEPIFLEAGEIKSGNGLGTRLATNFGPYEEVTNLKHSGTAWNHRKRTNRPYPGGVASRLSIITFVAMVMAINMAILLLQITQISNMKVIGFMVDF